jgi:hypothetical protein
MRAWEITENRRPRREPVTLRHLNQVNREQKRRNESERQRLELIPVMYQNTQHHRESLEIQRLELELMQLRQEIETERKSATYDAIGKMAKSGIDAMEKSENRLTQLARSGIGRKLKQRS